MAHPKALDRRKLQHKLIAFAETMEYPVPEEPELDANVIDPFRRGEYQGPSLDNGACESLFAPYNATRRAVQELIKREPLPVKYWQSAHNLLFHVSAHYWQEQPQMARETAGTAVAPLYHKHSIPELVHKSCQDLRLALDIVLADEDLCDFWASRVIISILVTSPLVLPDGRNYTYLRFESSYSWEKAEGV